MIHYYRFCCRIRITDEYAEEVPGGDFIAVEDGEARDRQEQFTEARLNEFSDWFHETPALVAHLRALETGRNDLNRRLVDTEAACLWSGRDRQTLYRWAKEERLSSYWKTFGLGGPRRAWDPLELPNAGSPAPARMVRSAAHGPAQQKNLGPGS